MHLLLQRAVSVQEIEQHVRVRRRARVARRAAGNDVTSCFGETRVGAKPRTLCASVNPIDGGLVREQRLRSARHSLQASASPLASNAARMSTARIEPCPSVAFEIVLEILWSVHAHVRWCEFIVRRKKRGGSEKQAAGRHCVARALVG